jgi:hypothetical protein
LFFGKKEIINEKQIKKKKQRQDVFITPTLSSAFALLIHNKLSHSYIGFLLAFASSIHNKQTNKMLKLPRSTSGLFYFRHVAVSVQLKGRVVNLLVQAPALRVNLNLDGVSITSRTHTHS